MISPGTSHRALYVGATRGRTANHLAVVSDESDLGAARNLLEYVLTTDPADVPAIAVRRELEQRGREIEPEPEPEPADPLAAAERAVSAARQVADPFERAVEAAESDLVAARSELFGLQTRHRKAGPIGRLRLRDQIANARLSLDEAQERHDSAVEEARPYRVAVGKAVAHRDDLDEVRRTEELLQRLDALQRRGPSRPGPELGLGR